MLSSQFTGMEVTVEQCYTQSYIEKATVRVASLCSRAICAVSGTYTRAETHRLVYSRVLANGVTRARR